MNNMNIYSYLMYKIWLKYIGSWIEHSGMEEIMIKVGIIGATGYAGQELVRLLLQHKEAEIIWYGSRSYVDEKFSSVFGNVVQIVEDLCKSDDLHTLSKEADVMFTATPQGYLAGVLDDEILKNRASPSPTVCPTLSSSVWTIRLTTTKYEKAVTIL